MFDIDEGNWQQAMNGRAKLTWRAEPIKNFSDWTIRVKAEPQRSETRCNAKRLKSGSGSGGDDHEQLFHVHKVILSFGERSSGYFLGQFSLTSATVETAMSTSVLELPATCASCFPSFLDYIYEGTLELSEKTVVPLMELARRFDVPALGLYTMQWVNGALETSAWDGVRQLLADALDFTMDKVKIACLGALATKFAEIDFDIWASLPLDLVIGILEVDELGVDSEDWVYDAVVHYLKTADVRDESQRRRLWLCVRFAYLSSFKQREALSDKAFPREFVRQLRPRTKRSRTRSSSTSLSDTD